IEPSKMVPFSFSPNGNPTFSFGTDVQAAVFLKDPREKTATEVLLRDLTGDGTKLDGPYVSSGSERLIGPMEANIENGIPNFTFVPDTVYASPCNLDVTACTGFDAVNVYYQIDRYVRDYWIDQLQFTP